MQNSVQHLKEEPKENLIFQLNVIIKPSQSKGNDKKVICQSKNHIFLGVLFRQNFYLVSNNEGILLHIKLNSINACISDDSKYLSACYHVSKGDQEYLLLYDLDHRQKKWIKKVQKHLNLPYLNFIQDKIIILTYGTMQTISVDGGSHKIHYLKEAQPKYKIQIQFLKLNDQLEMYGEKTYYYCQYSIFSMQSFKVVKKLYLKFQPQIIKIQQSLILEIPYKNTSKYRELFNGKIIRKFNKYTYYRFYSFGSTVIGDEFILFDYDGYYKINLSEGSGKFYEIKFPYCAKAHKSEFHGIIIDQKNKEIFKKNFVFEQYSLKIYNFIA